MTSASTSSTMTITSNNRTNTTVAVAVDGDVKQKSYLIVNCVAKKNNVGMLVRSCCALGVDEMFVVGATREQYFGAHGTDKFVKIRHFHALKDCIRELKSKGIIICGVEITPQSVAVDAQPAPFRVSSVGTAFMLGNEGDGMTEKQKCFCDHFVYIPQYGNGTASLNVAVAASIVLHRFGSWARFAEQPRDENDPTKFAIDRAALSIDAQRRAGEDVRQQRANTQSIESVVEFEF